MKALTENGILGDPTKASIEDGKVYISKVVDYLVEYIQKKLA